MQSRAARARWRRRRAASDAGDGAARIRIPMRSTQSGEGRHQIDTAGVRNARGQRFDLRRRFHQTQTVAQPLHHGTANENASFQSVLGLVCQLPDHRRQQPMPRCHRLTADGHEQEATGPVGIFRKTAVEAGLPEERRLLVARHAGNRNRRAEQRRHRFAVDFAGRTDLRQQRARHVQQSQQIVIPLTSVDIIEHRP